MSKIITVDVRWLDGYHEKFEATEVRSGYAYLWMRLTNGEDRNIPTCNIRAFSRKPESHFVID